MDDSLGQNLTGYDPYDRYYATRYKQGGRTVYSIDLSLLNVAGTLAKPDPNTPTQDNRRVKEKHARDFGQYVMNNPQWVAPALLLRAPDIFDFETRDRIADTEFGILAVPRLARTEIAILDGQHRILGLHLAAEEILQKITEQRNLRATAMRQSNSELVAHYEKEIRNLETIRERFSRERISIQIHIEDEQKAFKQMFVDIADNALGITSAIRARFDNRKVVNRALEDVLKHALLVGRVDMEQDRVGQQSQYLLGAKHVADIIRAVNVGISGRVGRRQENELREAQLVEKTNNYLDVLLLSFQELDDVVEGKKTIPELRKGSLLGSTSVLRVLAGAYYELTKDMHDDEISDFLSKLAPFMVAPVQEMVAGRANPWLTTGVFSVGTSGPTARTQDLQKLSDHIKRWAQYPPEWLQAA